MANLNHAVKTGMAWLVFERGSLQAINLVASMVLARLLLPADFGLLGMAVIFTGLAGRLVRFGFGMALVQRKEIRPDHVSTMFVLTLAMNTVVVLSLNIAAPYVGDFYDNAVVGDVLALMSLNFLLRGIAIAPAALLRRAMNFRAMTIGSILDAVVKMVVTIVLAYKGYGVWSLAYGELAGGVADKIVLVVAARWWPSFVVTRAACRDLFAFGAVTSASSIMDYVAEKLDNFVVGTAIGVTALGFYERAYRLMDLPTHEIAGRMKTVLFPAFARMQGDDARLSAAVRKTFLSLSLIGYPIFGSLIVLAPQVIAVMYGPRWDAVVLPFQILCIAGPARMVGQLLGSLIMAAGARAATSLMVRRICVLALLAVGTWIGTRWGIVGVAGAVALVNLIGMVPVLWIVPKITTVRLGDVFRPQLVPVVACVIAMVFERLAQMWAVDVLHVAAFWVVLISIAAGALPYAATLYFFRNDALSALLDELRSDLSRAARKLAGPRAAQPAEVGTSAR